MDRVRNRTLLAAAVTAAVVVVLAIGAWFLWPSGQDYRVGRATVERAATCDGPGARDRVSVERLDGSSLDAELDGCGNRVGEVLEVEIPEPVPAGTLLVRPLGTGAPGEITTGDRLAPTLTVLAGAAGGLLAWLLMVATPATRRPSDPSPQFVAWPGHGGPGGTAAP